MNNWKLRRLIFYEDANRKWPRDDENVQKIFVPTTKDIFAGTFWHLSASASEHLSASMMQLILVERERETMHRRWVGCWVMVVCVCCCRCRCCCLLIAHPGSSHYSDF